MAEIVTQDPGSTEVQSPLIAGLSEGLNKISKALNLTEGELKDEPLVAVNIDSQEQNKNRIYASVFSKKLWLRYPLPVIKKNGTPIQQASTPYTIDYIGGSVSFNNKLADSDKITVTGKYIVGDSTTITTIQNLLQAVSIKADRYKGYFDTESSLTSLHETAKSGDIAFVEKPQFAIYAWDKTQNKWRNTQAIEGLKEYYTKSQVDSLLGDKEPTISPSRKQREYFSGNKTWQDLDSAVRGTTLSGLSVTDAKVSPSDSLLIAIGKLQGQANNKKSWLEGTGEPTQSTKGAVGQRYINTSNGEWYTCKSISGSVYTWVKGQDNIEEEIKATYETKENIKVFSATFLLDGWQQSGGKWVQTANCAGMKAEYDTEAPWTYKSGNESTDAELVTGLNKICAGTMETMEGAIKATVTDKPSCDVPIYVRRSVKA